MDDFIIHINKESTENFTAREVIDLYNFLAKVLPYYLVITIAWDDASNLMFEIDMFGSKKQSRLEFGQSIYKLFTKVLEKFPEKRYVLEIQVLNS